MGRRSLHPADTTNQQFMAPEGHIPLSYECPHNSFSVDYSYTTIIGSADSISFFGKS